MAFGGWSAPVREEVRATTGVPAECGGGRPRHWRHFGLRATGRATEKSRSGQDRSQDPGLSADAVAQQSHGHIRFKWLLKGLNHVQGGPAQDGHDGGGVAPAQAAVVLAELHVQGVVQTVLNAPVAADQFQQGLRIHGTAGDVVAHRALPAPAGSGALGLHPDQAAQVGLGLGVRDPLAEAGAA